MAVEIMWDSEKQVAAMYCTKTDHAFGPVFSGPSANVEVGEFLDFLAQNAPLPNHPTLGAGDGRDPRDYSADTLERIVRAWCDLPTVGA